RLTLLPDGLSKFGVDSGATLGLGFQMPAFSSSAAARSLALWRADDGRGAGESSTASNRGVNASANRCSASRLVTQRPPNRSASNRTTAPEGSRNPFIIHRSTHDTLVRRF